MVGAHSPEWLFDSFVVMGTSRLIIFAVVAMFCAAVGITRVVQLNSEISADSKAYISKVVIRSLKRVGPKAEEHRRTDSRLPTDDEVICDWRPCPAHTLRLWHVAPEGDGGFSLTFYNAPALLMPGAPFATTWHSRDETTDLDGWDEPWRWRVEYYRSLLTDLAIILVPWVLLLWRRGRKRQSVAAAWRGEIMSGRCLEFVVLSAALLFGIPALAVAQAWPPGSAGAVGVAALEAKAKAVAALERANGDLVAALSDPAYQDRRPVAVVRSLQATWLDYVSHECDLVGISTLAASPWQSAYAVQCEVKLIELRAKQVAAAAECLNKANEAVMADFPGCVRPLAPLATQAGVRWILIFRPANGSWALNSFGVPLDDFLPGAKP
jgi:hypothetical protein